MKKNICWKCKHWEECFKNRYGNFEQAYMKKIWKAKDEIGLDVIYVEECDRFENERTRERIYKKD